MNRLAAQPYLACDGGGRFALADPSQQENHLRGPQLLPLKHGPTVEVVDALTAMTPIHDQLAFPGLAELACLLHTLSAVRASQPLRMKVFQQPRRAQIIIQ